MEMQLYGYRQLTTDLNQLCRVLNTLPLSATAKSYIDGVPVKDINTATVLASYKFDIASKLPNFTTYLKAGIDLSTQIPNCIDTKTAVDNVVNTVVDKLKGYTREKSYVSFDKQANAFVINAAGEAALERAVIHLTPGQETIYNSVQALFTVLADSDLNKRILSDTVYNDLKKELNLDRLVFAICENVK